MRFFLTALAAVALLGPISACDSFIDDTDPLINLVDGDSLNVQTQAQFLATGLKQSFNVAYTQTSIIADLLSDAGQFNTNVSGSTFPTYNQIDRADIPFDNNTVRGAYNAVNAYRLAADDLLDRAQNRITFTDDVAGTSARGLLLFNANLHGGLSRHFLASYFGPEPNVGGAPISPSAEAPGPVIPSNELYAQAIQKYTQALANARNDGERRLVNTLIARAHLYRGERALAGQFAATGMQLGDAPFRGLFESRSINEWWAQGGRGRTQVIVDNRFLGYQAGGDTRVVIERATNRPGIAATLIYQRQFVYPLNDSPMSHVSWQENSLIRAEAELFGAGGAAAALPFVNAVRTAAGLPVLTEVTVAALIEERDRQFFTQGVRLIDQRRFDVFHATTPQSTGSIPLGPWRYLPIPSDERDNNPNVD